MWNSISSNDQLIMNMFNIALQLEKPWKLAHIEFEGRDQAWHLYIDFERGTTFACPLCGSACKAYDTEKKQWRHLDFWNWKTFMHARLPRVKCRSCNKVTQVPVATEGKGKDTLERFKLHMTAKGATAQQIEEICCDMSPAFIRGIEEYFPDAELPLQIPCDEALG
ncbi:transposase family protein [Paenibacillus profundus]|uniref:transposase family protein n=1 Tax=Paenibacillus profundus TaxID=1173085 RepID=UPI001F1A05A3|nr:transposase family protein [Paenibacillus profundus]